MRSVMREFSWSWKRFVIHDLPCKDCRSERRAEDSGEICLDCPHDGLQERVEQIDSLSSQCDMFPTIVCLCGSTRFVDEFNAQNRRLTLEGKIVLSIGCHRQSDEEMFVNYPDAYARDVKAKLDELHLRKIDLADEVLVLNVGGYIGDSTRREIEYATSQEKTVNYLETVTP